QIVAFTAVDCLDSEGQLRVRARGELRQDAGCSPIELQRHPGRARYLDGAPDGDGRPAARQPDPADARQARIQRRDEGRGLYAAGYPALVTNGERTTRAKRQLLSALIVMAWSAPAMAQTVSQRGFVDGVGFFFPQEAPNDATRLVGDLLAREEVFVKP